MSSSESDDIESDADRIRRNDNRMTQVDIDDWHDNAIEILDALKNNTVIKNIQISNTDYLLVLEHQEALVKLSEVILIHEGFLESLPNYRPGPVCP
jgi:hypothetical protein